MDISKLHELINALVPIISISVGNVNDKNTWNVQYVDQPTSEILSQVQSMIDAYVIPTSEQILKNAILSLCALFIFA